MWGSRETRTGRIVYNRKKHPFTPSRIASIAMALINRFPVNDQPDEWYWGWQALAFVATNAMKSIGWRWSKKQFNQFVIDLRNDRNAQMIIGMRDFIRGAKAIINFGAQWGGNIPYVGQVMNIGSAAIDNVVNEAALSMPMIVVDQKTGNEIIYW